MRDDDTKAVSHATWDICEFLLDLHEEGRLDTGFGRLDEDLPYHAPCQLRSHGIGLPALDLFALVPGLRAKDMDHDCCGIAGTYGMKKEKYPIAMKVGEPLFKKVKDSGAAMAACDSETCRWQIETATGVRTRHPVEILRAGVPGRGHGRQHGSGSRPRRRPPALGRGRGGRRLTPSRPVLRPVGYGLWLTGWLLAGSDRPAQEERRVRRSRPHAPRSAPVSAADPAALPRVLVIGSGAVGSFLGGMLAAAGHEVILLDQRVLGGDDATRLRIEGPDGSQVVPVRRVVDAADAGDPACIVLAVKIFHLDGALETAARWPDAALLTVQNGVGAEALARAARHAPVLAGSLTTAVEPLPDGVKRMRTGGMGVAVVPGDGADAGGPVADLLAASWSRAGLPARVYPDAAAMKWSKLLGNLVGNATSAILDMDPGDIYADPRTYPVERRQLHEAVAVMKVAGPAAGLAARRRRLAPAARAGPARRDRPPDRLARHRRGPRRQVPVAPAPRPDPGRRRAHGGPLAQRRGRRRRGTDRDADTGQRVPRRARRRVRGRRRSRRLVRRAARPPGGGPRRAAGGPVGTDPGPILRSRGTLRRSCAPSSSWPPPT